MPEQIRYGLKFPDVLNNKPHTWSDLEIECRCFFIGGTDKYQGGVSKAQHFKNIVKMLWGARKDKPFVWNPWNEAMLDEACNQNFLWLSGCAASQKSGFGTIWGLVNWLVDPVGTCVLVTSTSLSDSKKRIWGQIEERFQQVCDEKGNPLLPGKLASSLGKIRSFDGNKVYPDICGVHLIAGEKTKEKENIAKLIGFHNKRIILICDEMPELSPALTSAAMSNLAVNEYFQMIGIGNFKSIYDPFGVAATPKGGWTTVSPESDRWECEKGVCLRFDALKSPNILLGEERYPGLYSAKHLKEHRESFKSENSAEFWRMCRSFPCPEADANRIYAEADFIKGDVHGSVIWKERTGKGAALDPAFVTGGDKAVVYFGDLGVSINGKQTLNITERLELHEDIRIVNEKKPLQIAKQYRDACVKRGIPPERAAYDASGGGVVFGSLLTEVWEGGHKCLGVQFGGAASNRAVSVKDKRPAKEQYTNRVSELWFAGVVFVESGQLKGITPMAASEMKERRYESVKGTTGLKNRVETKADMKARIGKSPDDADCVFILIELARERMGFVPAGLEGAQAKIKGNVNEKKRLALAIYQDIAYQPEMADA